jgi:bifunctional DNase/RNase
VSEVDEAPRDVAESEATSETSAESEDSVVDTDVAPGDSTDGAEASSGTDVVDEEPLGFALPKQMSKMLFVDVVLVLPSTHPVVVLQEADFPYRELRIPIGGPEGIAIGYASRRLATPRPLTHEFMTRLMESFGLTLDVVHITGLQGGMFTAEITVSGPTGQRVVDCRPSDGIALALRQTIPVPIMADPDVLDRAAGAAAGSN